MSSLVILYQDEHLLAVDKPPGILTVPAPGPGPATLADQVRRHLRERGQQSIAVHRLDRDTSGVVLFAKREEVETALIEQFKRRDIDKTYLALAHGLPRPERGVIRSFISDQGKTARSSRTRGPGGKEAVTEYQVLERFAAASLVEARPRTGRFNQIRLHLVDVGCPIVGERKYAVASRYALRFRRPLLHASRIALEHPVSGRPLIVEAPLAADFADFLAQLRR